MLPDNTSVVFTGWADAIASMCGISTGSTTTENNLSIPIIYKSRNGAESAVRESQDDYQEDIRNGERDFDDEYEGEATEIQVLNDGTLYFPAWNIHCTAAVACGVSECEIDMDVMAEFGEAHCFDSEDEYTYLPSMSM